MIGRVAALILLSTLPLIISLDTLDKIALTVLQPGDNLNMTCSIFGDKPGLFYWYKMKNGYKVQTVAAGTLYMISLKTEFNKSRFAVTKGNDLYFLHIQNVSKEDEATYICQTGSVYSLQFINGTLLVLDDNKNRPKSMQPGTKVDTKQEWDPVTVVLGILLGLCVFVIAILVFSRE